jgi:ABC-type dipeptide/oligopeptide/nickel transport system permease component
MKRGHGPLLRSPCRSCASSFCDCSRPPSRWLGVAVIVFVVIRVVPGNPIAMMLPPGATEADIARLSALYGLDKPIVAQYFIWLAGVLQGDFGTSISCARPVLDLVLGRLPATLELSIMALVMACLHRRCRGADSAPASGGTAVEGGIDVANGAALSIPDFLWGLVLILLFGVLVPVFHISGRVSPSRSALRHQLLPVRKHFPAALRPHGRPRRAYVHAGAGAGDPAGGHHLAAAEAISLKETMTLDYVTLARTKGFGETPVILREALRNAAADADAGRRAVHLPDRRHGHRRAALLLRGLGNMAIDAVINRDLPLIQGIVLVFAVIFIADQPGRRPARTRCSTRGCVMAEARRRHAAAEGWSRLWLHPARCSCAAIFAPWIAPKDPLANRTSCSARLPPFWVQGAEPGYWLGTDEPRPRRALAAHPRRRIALIVAWSPGSLTCPRRLDARPDRRLVSRLGRRGDLALVDIWMAFPPVLFSILLSPCSAPASWSVIIAIVVIDWTRFCRVVRAEAMSQARMDYVEAARVAGFGRIGTMLREILPNVLPTIVVAAVAGDGHRRHRRGDPVLRRTCRSPPTTRPGAA